jgi:hypothetical protein
MRSPVVAALLIGAMLISACGLRLPGEPSTPAAVTGDPAHQIEVSFTQVGNTLSVRLRNPNPDVGLVRSPFELAMIDKTGAVIATAGQGGIPGTPVNTIYQLPPGGDYGLDTPIVPYGKTVASVELTVLGKWFRWDSVNPPIVTVTDANVFPDTGYSGPSVTGRLMLDKDGPLNVAVVAFVKTSAGTLVSDVFVDCTQTGQRRTFQTRSFADARGPYELDKVVAYATVKGAGPQFDPTCSSAPGASPPVASGPGTSLTTTESPAGSCSVNVAGCDGYDECHPVVTGKIDCFPEDESCSKPGNTFPWCSSPPTTASTWDVSGTSTGGTGKLVAVRLGPRDGYDRLVLEFLDGVPSYKIGYRPLPAHADGSGDEIPLPGANALVQITMTGATGSGWDGGPRTYLGPSTLSADTAVVTEAKAAGDFEAVLNWVVGLRSQVPFRVTVLNDPARLVVDFQR